MGRQSECYRAVTNPFFFYCIQNALVARLSKVILKECRIPPGLYAPFCFYEYFKLNLIMDKPYIYPKDRKRFKYYFINGKYIIYPKNQPLTGNCK